MKLYYYSTAGKSEYCQESARGNAGLKAACDLQLSQTNNNAELQWNTTESVISSLYVNCPFEYASRNSWTSINGD